MNLLSNALKFTFAGEIRVLVEQRDGHARLAVSDTGIGIEPAEQIRLFERFHRVLGARARTHEGSGIGLALVAELARLHGGGVDVASTPGAGSTFTVEIPLGREHLPTEQVSDEPRDVSIEREVAGFLAEASRWLLPSGNGEAAARARPRRSTAHPRRRRQRRHARVRRRAAGRRVLGAHGVGRRGGARAGPRGSAGPRAHRRDDASPGRLRAAVGAPRRSLHPARARGHAVGPRRRGGRHRGARSRRRRLPDQAVQRPRADRPSASQPRTRSGAAHPGPAGAQPAHAEPGRTAGRGRQLGDRRPHRVDAWLGPVAAHAPPDPQRVHHAPLHRGDGAPGPPGRPRAVRARAGGGTRRTPAVRHEARLVHDDGSQTLVRIRGEVVTDEIGEPILLRGFMQDITAAPRSRAGDRRGGGGARGGRAGAQDRRRAAAQPAASRPIRVRAPRGRHLLPGRR